MPASVKENGYALILMSHKFGGENLACLVASFLFELFEYSARHDWALLQFTM